MNISRETGPAKQSFAISAFPTRGWERGRALRFALTLAAVLASATSIFAHDPPEEYYDRNITVKVEPGCARVVYRLELSQVSLFNLPQYDKRIDIGKSTGRAALEAACLARFKVVIPDRLVGF